MAISDADLNWALQSMYGRDKVTQVDGSPLMYRDNSDQGMHPITQEEIDAMKAQQTQTLAGLAQRYNSSGYMQQFTPEQAQDYLANPNGFYSRHPEISPNNNNKGIYNDRAEGGNSLWFGPQAAPQHNDTGGNPFSAEALLTGGLTNAYSEQGQTSFNDARYGASILALPFVGAGITAGLGAAGAGAAGAGAAGTEAGAGTLYAGETASGVGSSGVGLGGTGGGATGMGAGAAVSGMTGSGSLVGSAGSDTLGGSSMGEEGFDPSLLQDPSYWNPEGGTTGLADPGASGIAGSSSTYGSTDYMQAAKDMATQLGITPASALKYILTAGGAALGAARGGAKPAGTTTTTQDLPDWLKPYAQGNVAQGQQILNGINPNNPLLPASQNEAMKTIRGDYLDPNSNPYFASSVNDSLGLAKSQFASLYGGGAGQNVNNSGFQEGLARTLGQQATNAYSQNYQNERGRQATAAFGTPQFVSQSNAAPFSGNQAFQGLFPNVSSTSVPYFSNPLGGAFSGALGGYALGGGLGK